MTANSFMKGWLLSNLVYLKLGNPLIDRTSFQGFKRMLYICILCEADHSQKYMCTGQWWELTFSENSNIVYNQKIVLNGGLLVWGFSNDV